MADRLIDTDSDAGTRGRSVSTRRTIASWTCGAEPHGIGLGQPGGGRQLGHADEAGPGLDPVDPVGVEVEDRLVDEREPAGALEDPLQLVRQPPGSRVPGRDRGPNPSPPPGDGSAGPAPRQPRPLESSHPHVGHGCRMPARPYHGLNPGLTIRRGRCHISPKARNRAQTSTAGRHPRATVGEHDGHGHYDFPQADAGPSKGADWANVTDIEGGDAADIEFRILGPLEVLIDGEVVDLGTAKQRALLALLVMHVNQVVATERLVEDIWGDQPPARAANAVQVYVSYLRKVLEPDRARGGESHVLMTRRPGYVLRAEPDQVDALRFERLVDEGRRALAGGNPEAAARRLRQALDLWRGQALADVAYEPFADREANRLEELRVAAIEDRVEADLARGLHSDLVAELESLVGAHPLRERLWGQRMVALYRCGRQAEALRAYRDLARGAGRGARHRPQPGPAAPGGGDPPATRGAGVDPCRRRAGADGRRGARAARRGRVVPAHRHRGVHVVVGAVPRRHGGRPGPPRRPRGRARRARAAAG